MPNCLAGIWSQGGLPQFWSLQLRAPHRHASGTKLVSVRVLYLQRSVLLTKLHSAFPRNLFSSVHFHTLPPTPWTEAKQELSMFAWIPLPIHSQPRTHRVPLCWLLLLLLLQRPTLPLLSLSSLFSSPASPTSSSPSCSAMSSPWALMMDELVHHQWCPERTRKDKESSSW